MVDVFTNNCQTLIFDRKFQLNTANSEIANIVKKVRFSWNSANFRFYLFIQNAIW